MSQPFRLSVALTADQFAAILVGLRLHQAEDVQVLARMPQYEFEGLTPLDEDEVEALCQRLNVVAAS